MNGIAKPILKVTALTLVIVGLVALMFGFTIAREVPKGTVEGILWDESMHPLVGARVSLTSEGKYQATIRGVTDDRGRYIISDVPIGKYTGYASARGYESANLTDYTPFEVKEGKTTYIKGIQMQPREPYINGSIPAEFMPGEKVVISLNGYSRKPVTQIKLKVYRYNFVEHVRSVSGKPDPYDDTLSNWKNIGSPIYEKSLTVRTDSEGYLERNVVLPVKDYGGYLIDVRLESAETLFKTLITDLALVTKRAPGKTLIYATSFTKKEPIAGVSLELYSQEDERRITGKTDSDGLFVTNDLPDDPVAVLGSIGESYAIAHSYEPGSDESAKCYIYTDRPVYRPGHTVNFKGILRQNAPGRLSPMAGISVPVQIKNPDDQVIKSMTLQTNSYGSFASQFNLDPDAPDGYYSISIKVGGQDYSGSFHVEEYRKPEFKASVGFTKPRFIGRQPVEARVEASYYFGGPVAGAQVKYTVYKSPSYFYYYPDENDDASFYEELYNSDNSEYEDYGGYGEVLLEGEGQTDKNGVMKLVIPTKRESQEQEYTVEATITDASGRSIDVSGSVMVTPGAFALVPISDNYIYKPNQEVKTTVYAVDYDRNPVPNVAAKVSVYKAANDNLGHRGKLVFSRDLQMDSKGKGVFSFVPKENDSYEIVVTATDGYGNPVEGSSWVSVYSDEYESEGPTAPALQVTVDKKLYNQGDTSRVMITSPVKEGYVLFTIEGRRLFQQSVIHITSSSKIVDVPLSQEYAPNVYASACMVNGKELSSDDAPIPINPRENFLNVKITSDKQRYLPGETATYTINTTDYTGKGVSAEVSLGVVDESLYAIREDTTPEIKRFFHGPVENLVNTSVSFSSDYYGGEDKFQGKVRKYFPDTAYWNPSIVTDANGVASISFKMPDNLTTWRATARAVTMGTAVGSARQLVRVTKNILVRLQTPRFFRQRDEFTLSAVVHNYTDTAQRVRVWVDAKGIDVSGGLSRTVTIPSNNLVRVEWPAKAVNVGTATITVYAQGTKDQDAVQMEAPVLPHGVPEIVTAAGESKDNVYFTLNVPRNTIKSANTLQLGISSSIAGAALGITQALEDYQMESAEGIMDILLPNVVMYQAMKDIGEPSPQQFEKIQKMVKHDLRTVYEWQMPGGGWSWSEYGPKDPWMTAYVVYGLIRAKQAGISIDEEVLQRGIQATIDSLPGVHELGKRSTLIYVLALAGKAKPEWVDQILNDKHLQNYSLSLMMLSLVEMGEREKAQRLVPKLIDGANQSNLHCSWPETFEWGFYSCNTYETTAYAIRALLAVDPNNPCIDKGVRWLVDRRRGDRYDANYDTASVVYALADYLRVRKPVEPNYTAAVYVNGHLVRELTMDAASLREPELKVNVPASFVHTGRNSISIEKSGTGEICYWANLKYYSAAEDIQATSSKVSISREYYRLRLTQAPEGGLTYKPEPLGDTASVGELVRCRLILRSPKDFNYLIVEDMLPSGCEVVEKYVSPYSESGWEYWWGGETVHDNRITFMVDSVYKGKRVIEYDFRPEIKGIFHVMPATAQGSYEPDIYAHSSEGRLIVE